jgi:folate-binding protein YgfZ
MALELTNRAVIGLCGPEAREYLQGLITNDVTKVAPGRAVYAALLTPQGKILFDFLIAEGADGLLLDCTREARAALIKRLSLYKLRAKVEISARDDLGVLLDADGGFADPRLPALGNRAIAAAGHAPSGDEAYLARRLALGVPEGADFGSDRMFALDAGLDELHGVAFDKGCYVGQELTARMKHRGTARKRLLSVATKDGNALPALDTPIKAKDQEVGAIASTYGARGFALVRLDRLAEAAGAPFNADGIAVDVTKPGWLSA